MEHYYRGRGGELVTVDVRLLKEALRPAEGAPFAITDIRGFVNEALHIHPDPGIADDPSLTTMAHSNLESSLPLFWT